MSFLIRNPFDCSHGNFLTLPDHPRGILQPMQQSVESAPSLSPSSFANLLAALTAPAKKTDPAWNDDGLEDDVATLSYERALRTHARYRTGDLSDRSLTQPHESDPKPIQSYETIAADAFPVASAADTKTIAPSSTHAESWSANAPATALDRNLKSASITIRLSHAECEQLPQARRRSRAHRLRLPAFLHLRGRVSARAGQRDAGPVAA